MTLALATAIVSVLVGLAAAVAAYTRLWVLAPVRAFAVVAVAAAIAIHILPETIEAAGWWVLVPFALGFVAPPAVAASTRALGTRHRRIAAELSFAGVLIHQLGDGLGLGALTGSAHTGHVHWDFVIGVGAHTVPLVAVVALAFAELGGPRAAMVRAAALLAATLAGIALTQVDETLMVEAGPWVNAAVAGLLFHVLLHDADDRAVPPRTRPLEAAGAIAGACLPLLMGGHAHGDGGLAELLRGDLWATALALAPVVVVGGAIAIVAAPGHRRSAPDLAAIVAGPFTVLGLLIAGYVVAAGHVARLSDDLEVAGADMAGALPWGVQLGALGLLGAAIVARIGTAGFMTWLGGAGGHRHGHEEHGHGHEHGHGDSEHGHEPGDRP